MFETLSLSTSESFSELDASQTDLPSIHRFEDQMVAAAVAAAAASSSSLLVDAEEEEEEDYIILPAERMTTDPSDLLNSTFASILDEDDDDDSIMTPSPYSLMQTGKDILRVSFHIVVWKRFFCDFTLPLFSPNVLSLPLIISALFLGKCYRGANPSSASMISSHRRTSRTRSGRWTMDMVQELLVKCRIVHLSVLQYPGQPRHFHSNPLSSRKEPCCPQ